MCSFWLDLLIVLTVFMCIYCFCELIRRWPFTPLYPAYTYWCPGWMKRCTPSPIVVISLLCLNGSRQFKDEPLKTASLSPCLSLYLSIVPVKRGWLEKGYAVAWIVARGRCSWAFSTRGLSPLFVWEPLPLHTPSVSVCVRARESRVCSTHTLSEPLQNRNLLFRTMPTLVGCYIWAIFLIICGDQARLSVFVCMYVCVYQCLLASCRSSLHQPFL